MVGKSDFKRALSLRVLLLGYQLKTAIDALYQDMELTCDQGFLCLNRWADEAERFLQAYCRSIQKYDRLITCPVR